MSGPSLGFVGLGAMGGHMARRLREAGHEVHAFDTAAEASARAARAGARVCAGAREVADHGEIVLVSLPSPEVVAAVAGELRGGARMRVYVDLSTTGPRVSEEVASLLSGGGVACVDAPVSGGAAGAEGGKLTIMAAGSPGAIEEVRPLLEVLGERIFVVGERPGQGQMVKVINNLLSACSIAITAEAAVLGAKAGLDPARLLEVVAASSGANTAAADKFPRFVLTRTFRQGFRLELMAKDVRLCLAEGRRHGVPMVLGGVVEQLWSLGEASFPADADFIEIVRMFEGWAGTEIRGGTA